MRGLLLKDKKGLSAMVGYVLLIVIGISLAALVYAFLKVYVPSDKPVCPDNVALSIEEFSCFNGAVKIKLNNRGLFNVDGAYIRIGEEGRVFRQLLNEKDVHFTDWASEEGLPPGEFWPKNGRAASFPYNKMGANILEVEPAMYVDNEWTLCGNAVITQAIECTEGQVILGIEIEEPAGDYPESLNDIPLIFSVSGENRAGCKYTLDGGINNISISGCDTNTFIDDSIPNPGEGEDYIIRIYLADTNGEEIFGESTFNIIPDTGGNAFNEPSRSDYEFLDTILNPDTGYIPLDYSITSTNQCLVVLFDPFNAIKNSDTSCLRSNFHLQGSLFTEDEVNGAYRINYYDNTNPGDRILLNADQFTVKVDPDIDLTSNIVVCSGTLDWATTQRKNPWATNSDACRIKHYHNDEFQGQINLQCGDSGSVVYNNLARGTHTFFGYATDNVGKIGTDAEEVIITSTDPNCNSRTGGYLYEPV